MGKPTPPPVPTFPPEHQYVYPHPEQQDALLLFALHIYGVLFISASLRLVWVWCIFCLKPWLQPVIRRQRALWQMRKRYVITVVSLLKALYDSQADMLKVMEKIR